MSVGETPTPKPAHGAGTHISQGTIPKKSPGEILSRGWPQKISGQIFVV